MTAAPCIAAHPARRSVNVVVVAAILAGLVAGLVGPTPRSALAATAVTTADLNLRSGPGTSNQVLRVMPYGASVTLDGGQEGNWYRVSYGGTSGWASGDYLDFSGGGGGGNNNGGGGATGNATVAVGGLNLRSGASTNTAVLTVMPYGAGVTLTGQRSNGFVSVTYNGTSGWTYESYLTSGSSGGNPSPSPDPDPDPAPQPGPSGSATVAVGALNLRSGASTNTAVLAVMPYGAGVSLTGQRSNGFVSVTYNGTNGWTYESYLSIGGSPAPNPSPDPAPNPDPGPTGSATVAVGALNLRSGASTNTAVLAVMPYGAGVTLTGQRSNGFVSVTYGGTNGWTYESYLNIGGTPAPNPTPDPDPEPTNPTAPNPGSGLAVTTANMNMRATASTSSAVLTVVPVGASVTLTGVAQNGFYYVIYNGTRGWISSIGLVLGGAPNPNPGGSNLRGDTNGDGGLSQQEVIDIIYAAADRYGQPRADMLRVARCESNLDPHAINPSGSYGLFQFVPFTWGTTPYADEDIFDAYASANAAGWMWSVGRRNEWVCQ